MKQLFSVLTIIICISWQSCSKDDLNLADDEFLVTYLNETSKCHGLLVKVGSTDKERIRKVIREEEEMQLPNNSFTIAVLGLKREYEKGQKLILKLKKPDESYNGICTAEVEWYITSYVLKERAY